LLNADKGAVGLIPALKLASLTKSLAAPSTVTVMCVERVQKGIAYWNKQNNDVPAPNCVLKV